MTDDEQDKWLRAARPSTAADEGWAATPIGDAALRDIRARGRRSSLAVLRARTTRGVVYRGGLLAATAAAVVTALSLSNSGGGQGGPPQADPGHPQPPVQFTGARPDTMALVSYDTCEAMLRDLRAHAARHAQPYDRPYFYARGGVALQDSAGKAATPSVVPYDARTAAPEHSTTNTQERGVDEPDIVKTDGNRIVAVNGGILRIVDAASKKITGTIDLRLYAGSESAELLVVGDRALVILGNAANYSPREYYGPMNDSSRFGLLLVNLAGPPKVLQSMQTDGYPVDARLVGDTVRVVASNAPDFRLPQPTANEKNAKARIQKAVLDTPLSAWLPTYTVDGTTHTGRCTDVRHPKAYTGTVMTTVYTVDVTTTLDDLQPVSLAADGADVYATQDSLYITSSREITKRHVRQTTQLHRYDIAAGGKPTYLGSGEVPGTLLGSYSLSDYAGHLRVVTTGYRNWQSTSSALYELDAQTLKLVGQVGRLGQGERVYAVRLLGPLGYVVTFKRVDPLYVLDLTDATKPRVTGALKTPGYSTYLHPVGDGKLLGVGADLGKYNEPNILKLSLFDVVDGSAPRVLDSVRRNHTWGQLDDPHAFLYWAEAGIAAVPLQDAEGNDNGGLLVVQVGGAKLRTLAVLRDPQTSDSYWTGIERTLVIGDELWTLSDAGLVARPLDTLDHPTRVEFS